MANATNIPLGNKPEKKLSFPCTNIGTEASRNFARLTENVNYNLPFIKYFISND
jgi:hypothetical protein